MTHLLELDPYDAVEQALPDSGDDRLKALLAWAVLAPSPHNTQPWAWTVRDGLVELRADRARRLPVCDPDDRELTIGCGAALEHLLLRLGVEGTPVVVETLPGSDPDLLARVRTGAGETYESRPELVSAMRTRRTNRTAYHGDPMGATQRAILTEASEAFGVHLHWLDDDNSRTAVVGLIMEADRAQMASTDFRRELAHWMRPRHSRSGEGMQADLLGQHGVAAYVAPLVVRTFDVGAMQAARDRQLTEGSPDLVILATAADDPAAWLGTGRALARLTLEAQAAGWASAYMNQPCELPEARLRLAGHLPSPGHPQLLIRLGLAGPVHAAGRLPVARVLRD